MTTNGQHMPHVSSQNEELDLFDLLAQLWRGRRVVISFFILALIISGGYLLVAKERWQSVATISLPDSAQVAAWQHARSIRYNMTPLGSKELEEQALNRFAVAFRALGDTLDNQTPAELLTIEPVGKGQAYPLTLRYQGPTAEAAQKGLRDYVSQINQKVAGDITADMMTGISTQVEQLQASLATQRKIAEERQVAKIAQIREALKYAEAAGLTQPKSQMGQPDAVNQDTLFLLGSEALKAMLDSESSRPLVLPDSYYQTRQQLLDLQKITLTPDQTTVYRYVLAPTLPQYKAGPKRALILLIGGLLGIMVGSGVVLGRNAWRSWKRQHDSLQD